MQQNPSLNKTAGGVTGASEDVGWNTAEPGDMRYLYGSAYGGAVGGGEGAQAAATMDDSAWLSILAGTGGP